MKDWQSQSHVKWECKYHVVIVPKYRKKVMYGNIRHRVRDIIRQLCRQKGVELLEGHAMAEVIVPRALFCEILERIGRLRVSIESAGAG